MKEHVTVAAPRFLLRLFALRSLYRRTFAGDRTPLRVCEIGPGLGDVASYTIAALDVESMDLYELSPEARTLLTERFGHDCRVRVAGEFVPTRAAYDLILCFEVVEHIEGDIDFLAAVADSLRPGGRLIGSVPAHPSKWQAVDELAGHFRRYSVGGMRDSLLAAGFECTDVRSYGFPLINLLNPLRHRYYSRELRGRVDDDRRAATIRSGTARGVAKRFSVPLVYGVARCFDPFRHLPGKTALDDGLIFVGTRG